MILALFGEVCQAFAYYGRNTMAGISDEITAKSKRHMEIRRKWNTGRNIIKK